MFIICSLCIVNDSYLIHQTVIIAQMLSCR